jgi:sugar phosphate isomerase/epimerase
MSKFAGPNLSDGPLLANTFSRRDFVRSGALVAGAMADTRIVSALFDGRHSMKQLNVFELNAKEVKDHLPTDPQQEAAALADYAAAGVRLRAAGTIYFAQDEDADIRDKFEYCKRAGIAVIVAGEPSSETLPRIEKFVKEYDIRIAIHNHGPEDKLWHSPLDVLRAVKGMDPRIGCCIDVGHTVRAGTDVVQAIHEAGSRLHNVHMKDLADFQAKDSQVAVGDGVLPVRKMFEALIAIKYKGFAYMRGMLAGLGYASQVRNN